ncbi:MAG: hypothetical protein COU69_01690 [Candidatus Pacebacteria bacterium CG10_big_fil_rev_8_21_14_0_10_56_10]|nr:MAG: hypothetical protein COU69_01690 [Candidatus Pacebacteria bacterium CG10_big_fil_rev_8_21_14_0_10_56_10]
MSLDVGIDLSSLVYRRGVSRYTGNLARALDRQPGIKLHVFGSSLRQRRQLQLLVSEYLPNLPAERLALRRLPPSVLRLSWKLGYRRVRSIWPKLSVFHSWDWLQPPDTDLPLVSTVHDLAILKFPETAHPRVLKAHQESWRILKERRAQLTTVSRATKQDLIELLGFSEQRVHVTSSALPQESIDVTERLSEEQYQQLVRQWRLDQPFILFVGTLEPRKNVERLIQAWQPLRDDFQLILAGAAGWQELPAADRHPQLRWLGQVSDQLLAVLYEQAQLLAYPSLYEGFGLPILEAFYHGTPVVTSAAGALPEVAGNAAELVNPESVESIRQGIVTVLEESAAAQRQRLKKMVLRLQLFDWQYVAEQTVQVYQQAVSLP